MRYSFGPDCKREVMNQVAGFKLNNVAQARIKRQWQRMKSSYNKKRQDLARTRALRSQIQFKQSSKKREKAIAAENAIVAEVPDDYDDDEGVYVSSQEQNARPKKEIRKSLKK